MGRAVRSAEQRRRLPGRSSAATNLRREMAAKPDGMSVAFHLIGPRGTELHVEACDQNLSPRDSPTQRTAGAPNSRPAAVARFAPSAYHAADARRARGCATLLRRFRSVPLASIGMKPSVLTPQFAAVDRPGRRLCRQTEAGLAAGHAGRADRLGRSCSKRPASCRSSSPPTPRRSWPGPTRRAWPRSS